MATTDLPAVRRHSAGERAWTATKRVAAKTWASKPGRAGLAILIFFTVMALTAPWLAPEDPTADFHPEILAPPSSEHWLGTDGNGADVLSRLPARLAHLDRRRLLGRDHLRRDRRRRRHPSGYYGGWIDKVLTAIDDWFLVIPFLPFAIVVATAARPRRRRTGPAAASLC